MKETFSLALMGYIPRYLLFCIRAAALCLLNSSNREDVDKILGKMWFTNSKCV